MNETIFPQASHRIYDVLGDRCVLLLSSEVTGNAYSLFEISAPKDHGPPPHVHSREDESFYILSGEIDFTINGKTTRAKKGDSVFAPRGFPHSYKGVSDEPNRFICMVSPGGFEKFFAAIGKLVTDKTLPPLPPTEAEIQNLLDVAPQFGIKML